MRIYYQLAVISQSLEKAWKFLSTLALSKDRLMILLQKLSEGIYAESVIFSGNVAMRISTYEPPKYDNILGMVANWSPFKGKSPVKFDLPRLRPAVDPQLCHCLNHIEITLFQVERWQQSMLSLVASASLRVLDAPSKDLEKSRETIQMVFLFLGILATMCAC